VPTDNLEIAQEALYSFLNLDSHGHNLQATGTQQDRILIGVLAALIDIADSLGVMAAVATVIDRDGT
jgi:hypothetical protein